MHSSTSSSFSNASAFPSTGVSRLLNSPLIEKTRVFKMDEIQKMTDKFKYKLGGGGFSSVYKGTLGNLAVAIKKYQTEASKGFDTEVLNLIRGQHPHIIKLIGISVDKDPCIVLEYAQNGSLEDYLKGNLHIKLNKIDKLRMFIDLCDTLVFLHIKNIVHRDIKPGNILLTGNKQVKFADFSIARYYDENERENTAYTTTRIMASPGYTCPMWLTNRQCGTFTDIYGLGLTMLVVMAENKKPYQIYNEAEEIIEEGKIGKLKKFFKDNWTDDMALMLLKIGYECLNVNRKERPSARQLSIKLKNFLKEVYKGIEEGEDEEEKRFKLELRNKMLYKQRKKLKNSIDKIKEDTIAIKQNTKKEKDDINNIANNKIKELAKENRFLTAIMHQYSTPIYNNRIASISDVFALMRNKQGMPFAILHTYSKENCIMNIKEKYSEFTHHISSLSTMPDKGDSLFMLFDMSWIQDNFHNIIHLCHQIKLCNVKEIILPQSLIFSNEYFHLLSISNTNLKISNNKNIVISKKSTVIFKGINIMECDYGDKNAIIIESDSAFHCYKSSIARNKGKHALIKVENGSTLELYNVNFSANTTTETLPIIIDADEGENINIHNCKFVCHHINESVKKTCRNYMNNILLIKSKSKDIKIVSSCFENNIVEDEEFHCSLIYVKGREEQKSSYVNVARITASNFINCIRSNFDNLDKLNIRDCIFCKNKTLNGRGGALNTLSCKEIVIEETDFKKNLCVEYGGAIHIGYNEKIVLNECRFEENVSKRGGAIYIMDGICDMKKCQFRNNDSEREGYDIANTGSNIKCVAGCTFVSTIDTRNNISIYNECDGLFNGSEENIIKNTVIENN